jgi:Predicted integral membrane protein
VTKHSGSTASVASKRVAGGLIGLLLLGGAVFVLRAELRQHSLAEILSELKSLPPLRVGLSLVATVLGYFAFAGYDAVALAYLDRRLPFRRTAYAAFLGYAFANSLPLSVVTGASVRYRLYSQWGIARGEAAQVMTLNTITYLVGLLATAGIAFAVQPVLVPGFLRLPLATARPLGILCILLVAAYLLWSMREGGPLKLWRWELPRPTFKRALAQLGVSAADWVFSGAALYVLLPQVVPFHVFFAVFLLGQIAALVAQVPAGLGVFEAVMLWSLAPAISPPAMLVGLAGYRVIYFLLPLLLATAVWAVTEIRRWARRHVEVRKPAREGTRVKTRAAARAAASSAGD